MNRIDSDISNLLNQYLIDTNLSKIAYFTNSPPTKSDSDDLSGFFSYMCLCASSLSEQSALLFNKYWAKFKKVPFDVLVSNVEECIIARQFNFISLKYKNMREAKKAVSFVKENKRLINRNYPILLKLIIESDDLCDFIEHEGLDVDCMLSSSEAIIRIEK